MAVHPVCDVQLGGQRQLPTLERWALPAVPTDELDPGARDCPTALSDGWQGGSSRPADGSRGWCWGRARPPCSGRRRRPESQAAGSSPGAPGESRGPPPSLPPSWSQHSHSTLPLAAWARQGGTVTYSRHRGARPSGMFPSTYRQATQRSAVWAPTGSRFRPQFMTREPHQLLGELWTHTWDG